MVRLSGPKAEELGDYLMVELADYLMGGFVGGVTGNGGELFIEGVGNVF